MDLSEKLKQIVDNEKEAEIRSKNVSKMTEKKYELQKKLKDINTLVDAKKGNLTDIRREVVHLGCIMSVVKVKEKSAKESVDELVLQVVAAEKETEDAQISYWKQVNDFIANSTQYLKKHPCDSKKGKSYNVGEKNQRELKLQHLKLEGNLEALRSFEKYQNRKIEELKLLKEMLEI